MPAKKFTFLFLALFSGIYALFYLSYYLVNPEQLFSHSLTNKKFFYTKEYSRRQFEALKHHRYTLIFGTSQIHRISTKIIDRPVLNFHNLYGEPGDILNFLHQLNKEQIGHIDEIFYCIDLSAKAGREEGKLINYSKKPNYLSFLTREQVARTFDDIIWNSKPMTGYLNADGSIENLDVNRSSRIKPYIYPIKHLYHQKLIDEILQIDQFAKEHHIAIHYFTPVTSDAFFRSIDFNHLKPFFTALLQGGIKEIGLYYYIPGMTDIKNRKLVYAAFMDSTHLNVTHLKKWLAHYILNERNPYLIHDQKELDHYIEQMNQLQEQYK